jgi:CheY-like chemotaxis protein
LTIRYYLDQGYELVPKNDSSCLVDILTTVAMIIDSYGRQVPIYFSIAPNICNEIITDNEWVWQMLLNFLTNACKHTEEGCIHVNVSLCTGNQLPAGRKVDKEDKLKNAPDMTPRPTLPSRTSLDEHLLFQICDTGVGVGILKHDSLFEVFSQAQSGQSAGTGLGLFSVYSRCKRLGGACGVISPNTIECEGGSTFWFTIPYIPASKECMEYSDFSRYPTSHALCKSCLMGGTVVMGIDVTWSEKALREEAERDASLSSEGSAGVSGENGKKMRYTAFVVDDVQSIRKLLKRTLIGLGFTRVEVFENGKRALDAMKREVVDVVFMDIQVFLSVNTVDVEFIHVAWYECYYELMLTLYKLIQMPIMSGPEVRAFNDIIYGLQ